MKEIGLLLKQTRESQGKSLEDISSQTKIQLPTLLALENGEFGKVTNKAFLKGFIRQYAKALGLNADDLLSTYDKSTAGTPEPKPMPVSKLDSNQLTEKTNLLWFRTPSQFITLGAVVIILVLITSIYFISMKIVSYSQETVRNDSAAIVENADEESTSSTATPVETLMTPVTPTEPQAANTSQPQSAVAPTADDGPEEEEPPPRGVAPAGEVKQKMVAIEARSNLTIEAAWSTGKKETIQLNANSRHVFYYLEKIKIVLSDGGGAKVTTHEKSLGIPGESGKPITMNFH